MDSLLNAFYAFAARLQTVAYFSVAGAALLIYDYFTTLPLECKYVWRAPWNFGKVLYILTRYIAFVDVPIYMVSHIITRRPSPLTCLVLFNLSNWFFLVGYSASSAVLGLRTWIIWNRNKIWTAMFGLLCLAAWSCAIVLSAMGTVSLNVVPSPDPAIIGCLIDSVSGIGNTALLVLYALLTAYELSILVLTLSKGVQYLWDDNGFLITTLYKDAIIFGSVTSFLSLMNVVIISATPEEYAYTLVGLHRVMHSILSCRVLLNLRQADSRPSTTGSQISPAGYELTERPLRGSTSA